MQQVFFFVFLTFITCGCMHLFTFTISCSIAGSPKVIKEEFSEDETAETVTCVVLTDNHSLV
jgi:hypothetical protein